MIRRRGFYSAGTPSILAPDQITGVTHWWTHGAGLAESGGNYTTWTDQVGGIVATSVLGTPKLTVSVVGGDVSFPHFNSMGARMTHSNILLPDTFYAAYLCRLPPSWTTVVAWIHAYSLGETATKRILLRVDAPITPTGAGIVRVNAGSSTQIARSTATRKINGVYFFEFYNNVIRINFGEVAYSQTDDINAGGNLSTLGARPDSSHFADCGLGSAILGNGNVGTEQRQQIRDYIEATYILSA